jgi:class 3 adenylate cyclase
MGDQRWRSRAVWRLGLVWALRCATYFTAELDSIGLAIRASMHIGKIEERGDDVTGLAINIAASIMWHAGAGEVLLTRTLMGLTCGSGLVFGPARNRFFGDSRRI